MKILLFAGAGTSIELGVPGMAGLAEEFMAHSTQWNVEPTLVKQLIGATQDIEHLIEGLDRICSARVPLAAINADTDMLARADKVRAEVEWFVQHAAERVTAHGARLMWGPTLRASTPFELTVVTTNYDRAIELAANAEGIAIQDGFGSFQHGETADWRGFERDPTSRKLIKLHGSTDWYEKENNTPTKLRHPMPLFGRTSLRLPSGANLGSALVLPSREKLLTRQPYPRLSQAFLNAADDCDIAIFVGSSLRDPHVLGAAKEISSRTSMFLVDPFVGSLGISGANVIRLCASTFLIGVLPNALLSSDPVAALISLANGPSSTVGIMDQVKTALDVNDVAQARCRALDAIDSLDIALDPETISGLLNDESAIVARYALGLILHSPKRVDLLRAASLCRYADVPAFTEDMVLLREMVK